MKGPFRKRLLGYFDINILRYDPMPLLSIWSNAHYFKQSPFWIQPAQLLYPRWHVNGRVPFELLVIQMTTLFNHILYMWWVQQWGLLRSKWNLAHWKWWASTKIWRGLKQDERWDSRITNPNKCYSSLNKLTSANPNGEI